MIRAIIVDDEEKSRYGLSEMFDFASHGVRVEAYAANGHEALEIIERTLPELVLTDVKMPVMDGIALAEAVVARYPDIRVVFISGYDDMAYIKAAFRLDVFDYLIKPIDVEEFDDVLRRVVARIHASQRQSRWMEDTRRQLDDTLPHLLEKYHRDLLLGDGSKLVPIPPLLAGKVAERGPFIVLLLLLPGDEGGGQAASPTAVMDLCRRQLPGAVITRPAPQEFAILLAHSAPVEAAFASASKLHAALLDVLALPVTLCVGCPVEALAQVGHSYRSALALRERRVLGAGGQILLHGEGQTDRPTPSLTEAEEAGLLEAMQDGDEALLASRVAAIFEGKLATGITLAQCRLLALRVLHCGAAVLRGQGASPGGAAADPMTQQARVTALDTPQALLAYVQDGMRALLADLALAMDEMVNLSVRRMQKYIRTHFAEGITVQDVAGEVYLAVPYACTLFKQETGMTIKEYVVQQRIRRAKELLSTTHEKLYAISQAVGYADQAYFARQFRKLCGMGPAEYRNKRGGSR